MDAHAHLAEGGMDALRSVDLSDVSNMAQLRSRLAERVGKLRPGQWLTGSGWDEAKLAEKRYPRTSDLPVGISRSRASSWRVGSETLRRV